MGCKRTGKEREGRTSDRRLFFSTTLQARPIPSVQHESATHRRQGKKGRKEGGGEKLAMHQSTSSRSTVSERTEQRIVVVKRKGGRGEKSSLCLIFIFWYRSIIHTLTLRNGRSRLVTFLEGRGRGGKHSLPTGSRIRCRVTMERRKKKRRMLLSLDVAPDSSHFWPNTLTPDRSPR